MQAVRSNLTRIKHGIEGKIPAGPDVLGYAGISRSNLLEMIDSAYDESYKLAESESEFEVTLLKRKISENLEYCRSYVNEYKDDKKAQKNFDEFLRKLTSIRDDIRLSYLVVTSGGLRDEEYLIRLESSRQKAESELEVNLNSLSELKTRVDEISETLNSLNNAAGEADELLEGIKVISNDINAAQAKVTASFEVVTKYESQISEAHSTANESTAEIAALLGKGEKANSLLSAGQKEVEEIRSELEEQIALNNSQQEEIENTLAAANRVGMAGSFYTRKSELRTSLLMWGICFVLTVLGIFWVGFYFITPYINSDGAELLWSKFILKLAVVAPLVWLAWMSARQFGYVSKIREDYAFKYATAMAFEGYRKHARDIDETLLTQLLGQSLEAMRMNPIRLYAEKVDHASPVHEVADKIIDKIPKVKLSGSKVMSEE